MRRRQLLLLPAALVASMAMVDSAQAVAPASGAGSTPWSGWRTTGAGIYTYWGFDVYEATLRIEPAWSKAWDDSALTQAAYALELRYLRDFRGADIARRSIDEMRRLGSIDEAQADAWLQGMRAAFPDVARGDRLTGLHLPGEGARFFHNDQPCGDIRDEAYARRFFGIWLAGATTAPELRSRLLAGLAKS